MAQTPMNDPRIVKYAQVRFQFFLDAGDKLDSALGKSIYAALKKYWRRLPPKMHYQGNIERYGAEYAELQRLVMAGNGEMPVHKKAK